MANFVSWALGWNNRQKLHFRDYCSLVSKIMPYDLIIAGEYLNDTKKAGGSRDIKMVKSKM